MTARGFYTLLFGAIMMLTALSVGSAGAFLLGAAALIVCALSLASVLWAKFSFQLKQDLGTGEVCRGGRCQYTLCVRLASPLPVAPLSLRVSLPSGRQSEFALPARLFGWTQSDDDFSCPHVGVFPVGVTQVTFDDVFAFFSLRSSVHTPAIPIAVLPVPREAAPLETSPGEGENTSAQRAHADRTTPADTRPWQDGDELKRVHWKLSMRRQELMVHTYEMPQRPDALILLDLAPPPAQGALRAAMIDALTETAAGILKALLEQSRTARMPLTGDHPRELSGQDTRSLSLMLHALAQESFSRPSDFARVLMLASRRMRRTGSTAIVTACLTPAIADAVIALSRMGPKTHLCLIVHGDPSGEQDQLVHLLQTCGVQTEIIPV